jgi:hypothetical protein
MTKVDSILNDMIPDNQEPNTPTTLAAAAIVAATMLRQAAEASAKAKRAAKKIVLLGVSSNAGTDDDLTFLRETLEKDGTQLNVVTHLADEDWVAFDEEAATSSAGVLEARRLAACCSAPPVRVFPIEDAAAQCGPVQRKSKPRMVGLPLTLCGVSQDDNGNPVDAVLDCKYYATNREETPASMKPKRCGVRGEAVSMKRELRHGDAAADPADGQVAIMYGGTLLPLPDAKLGPDTPTERGAIVLGTMPQRRVPAELWMGSTDAVCATDASPRQATLFSALVQALHARGLCVLARVVKMANSAPELCVLHPVVDDQTAEQPCYWLAKIRLPFANDVSSRTFGADAPEVPRNEACVSACEALVDALTEQPDEAAPLPTPTATHPYPLAVAPIDHEVLGYRPGLQLMFEQLHGQAMDPSYSVLEDDETLRNHRLGGVGRHMLSDEAFAAAQAVAVAAGLGAKQEVVDTRGRRQGKRVRAEETAEESKESTEEAVSQQAQRVKTEDTSRFDELVVKFDASVDTVNRTAPVAQPAPAVKVETIKEDPSISKPAAPVEEAADESEEEW